MARYIDADSMQDFLVEQNDIAEWTVSQYNADWISSFIESQPTADVVKVVRCKDCIYYKADGFVYEQGCGRCEHPQQAWNLECYDQWVETRPDDFCSYGTPKESEVQGE